MYIVHTGDWHLEEGPTFDSTLRCLNAIVEQGTARSPDLWVVGGDLAGTTVPHRQTITERNALARIFQAMANVAPVIIPYGNHDYPHDLDVFARLEANYPIVVTATPRIIEGGAGRVYVLPYPSKRHFMAAATGGAVEVAGTLEGQKAQVENGLRAILATWTADRQQHPTAPAILVAHCNIGGSRTAGGEVLIGHEIELSPLDLEALGVDYVALSHIHLYQQMARNAWYAGSPDRSNFGESDEKGFLFVEVEAGQPPIVTRCLTPARRLVTVTATLDESGQLIDVCKPEMIEGAEVRVRVTYPESCQADAVIQQLTAEIEAAGGRLAKQPERHVLPVTRLRSEQILTAHTTADKLSAFWATLTPPPSPEQQARCLAKLPELHEELP